MKLELLVEKARPARDQVLVKVLGSSLERIRWLFRPKRLLRRPSSRDAEETHDPARHNRLKLIKLCINPRPAPQKVLPRRPTFLQRVNFRPPQGLSGEIEDELLIIETQKRARKPQTLRRHRGGRASRPSRLRRSLRCASRALTPARLDGLVQPRRFADRNGRTAGFGSKTSWSPIATPSDRSHPQGRSAAEHPSWRLMGGYRFARTFEAPWRVDGDRAAWRRGVESKSSAPLRRRLSPDSPARCGEKGCSAP